MTIGLATRLSELQALVQQGATHVPSDRSIVPECMLRSVAQSMRVEGYTMSREQVIAAVATTK